MDLSGLPETAVDSEEDDDEEDIERASDPLMSRDIVRDCLEKDPMDRTDDDIGEHPVWSFMFSLFIKLLNYKLSRTSNSVCILVQSANKSHTFAYSCACKMGIQEIYLEDYVKCMLAVFFQLGS